MLRAKPRTQRIPLRYRIADHPITQRVRQLWTRFTSHPVVAAVTPLGWALLFGGIAVGLIGWNRGWVEFRSLAVMALVVLVVGALLTLRRSELVATIQLHRPRVQVGDEALGAVLIRPAGHRGSGGSDLELPVGRARANFRVEALKAEEEHEELFAVPTRRRGVVSIGPVRSVQSDPIGVVSRERQLTEQVEVFVHPKIVHVEAGAVGMLKDVEGITTANLSSSDVSFHALREYVPGDDRRSVHWRTTARTGKLIVRQFEETMRAHLLIMLANRVSDYEDPNDFELAVSVAASLGVAALRNERRVSLYTSQGEVVFPSALGFLDELCRVELVERGGSARDVALEAGAESGISVAGFVTGAQEPPELRRAQLALPPSINSFALRCDHNLAVARRRVGELTVLDLAQLDDLPLAVRSLS